MKYENIKPNNLVFIISPYNYWLVHVSKINKHILHQFNSVTLYQQEFPRLKVTNIYQNEQTWGGLLNYKVELADEEQINFFLKFFPGSIIKNNNSEDYEIY